MSSESEPEDLPKEDEDVNEEDEEDQEDVNSESDDNEMTSDSPPPSPEKPQKKEHKAGIIYLSRIPPGMKIQEIREYFSAYGQVKRAFLQPDTKAPKTKWHRMNPTYTEGWIEFRKRKQAKLVAGTLNNCPVGGKKSKPYHDFLWNIKYLPGFQWVHLNERLAYERISNQQKLRAEISAAKRETSFFAKSIGLKKRLNRLQNNSGGPSSSSDASKTKGSSKS